MANGVARANSANTTSMSSTDGTLPYVRDSVSLNSRTGSNGSLALNFRAQTRK